MTAILGMTFGLSMIWAIRIVGKLALGMEAMGLGDVTLMAMVGSIVGWQSCLPILAISAFVALGVTLPIYLVKQDKALPYGPYLSIGTIIVILFWPQVWEGYFKGILLLFGIQNVFLVLACMTIPLFLLLHIVRFFKNVIFGVQE